MPAADGEDEDRASAQVLPFDIPDSSSLLSPGIQARIGAGLRAVYAELKEQPLPERLTDLIRQLEAVRGGGAPP